MCGNEIFVPPDTHEVECGPIGLTTGVRKLSNSTKNKNRVRVVSNGRSSLERRLDLNEKWPDGKGVKKELSPLWPFFFFLTRAIA